jgi:hypothetical protein
LFSWLCSQSRLPIVPMTQMHKITNEFIP